MASKTGKKKKLDLNLLLLPSCFLRQQQQQRKVQPPARVRRPGHGALAPRVLPRLLRAEGKKSEKGEKREEEKKTVSLSFFFFSPLSLSICPRQANKQVGTGRKDYYRAVKAVSSWKHADALPWVSTNKPRLLPQQLLPRRRQRENNDENESDGGSKNGLVIAARAAGPFLPFLPLWLVNPLEIVEVRKERRARGGVPDLCGGGKGEEEGLKNRRQPGLFFFSSPPSSVSRRRPPSLSPGRFFSVRATTCSSHVLAGAESFSVFLNESKDGKEKGVWFEVASFSRPAAALSLLTLPLVRVLQGRFRVEAARAVAEAVREGK